MSTTVKQPLKWPGGKNYLARQVVALMPRHLNYVEPYFGGGAVLMARDPDDERLWLPPHKGVSEVVNDIDRGLTNFWQVMQDHGLFEEFRRRVGATPFSEVEFDVAAIRLEKEVLIGAGVEWAFSFFVHCRMSLAGRQNGFTGITRTRTRSRMNNEVSAWLSCVDGLSSVHERLRRVLILNAREALDVIRDFDGPATFFYLDPPYLHETRQTTTEYGAHEMSVQQHKDLLCALGNLRGKFLLSGYRSALYDGVADCHGWKRHDFDLPNQAAGGKTKRRMTECVWANYAAGR